MGSHKCIVGGQGSKFIFCRHKGIAGQLGNDPCRPYIKASGTIQPGAHGCSPQGQFKKGDQSGFQILNAMVHHGGITGELLAKGQGNGIHKMGSTGFHNGFPGTAFFGKPLVQKFQAGQCVRE